MEGNASGVFRFGLIISDLVGLDLIGSCARLAARDKLVLNYVLRHVAEAPRTCGPDDWVTDTGPCVRVLDLGRIVFGVEKLPWLSAEPWLSAVISWLSIFS
jgi:hypothetical protein